MPLRATARLNRLLIIRTPERSHTYDDTTEPELSYVAGARPLLRRIAIALLFVLAAFCSPRNSYGQTSPACTVSVLNRSVEQQADGSWILPNVPANFGPVRARMTCIQNGQTVSGESDPFVVPANGVVNLPPIHFGQTTPVPLALSLSTASMTLAGPGQTTQLTVMARYSDSSTKDVTSAATFTQYTVSNPRVATVSPDGLVTAVASGIALIQATHEGASGMVLLRVSLGGGTDSDSDGIPDDVEASLGMNPNDPVDAAEDFDRDNATNLREFQAGSNLRVADTDSDGLKDGDEFARGTSPLLKDTDGDLISDGLEVRTNTNPLDRNNYDLRAATATSVVLPGSFVLTTSAIFPGVSRRLTWNATLLDGTLLDLTADPRTTITSSDLTICNFGLTPGQVFAGSAGNCVVTLTNSSLSATASGTVQTFTPTALSFVDIPGFANNVDVRGNYAYVAAGLGGLRIVDVSNHAAPVIRASRALPGNANDVVVVGHHAFVAAGTAGLQIVDVTDPLQPSVAGSVSTGGTAWDVVVKDNRAYVANGSNGLAIVDVTNPAQPILFGTLALSGITKGVDVDPIRLVAVVARGTGGLAVVNVANPVSPSVMSTLAGGDVRDVVVSGSYAFLADFSRSFTAVDISNPAAPVVRSSTPMDTGGFLQDVAVRGSLAVGADVRFVNGIPAVDISTPAAPQPRAIVNFAGFRDDNGNGIALDNAYVYLTAEAGSAFTENGITGTTRLYIGQYQTVQDNSGVAPTVLITGPSANVPLVEGAPVTVRVSADDDIAVASVSVTVDGVNVGSSTTYPYEFPTTVPTGRTSLTIRASATDLGGNVGSASAVLVPVSPDVTPPLVTLATPTSGATVVEGSALNATVQASDDARVMRVDLLVDGLAVASRTAPPYRFSFPVGLGAAALNVVARAVDPSGNVGQTSPLIVTVLPEPAPTVSVTPPAGGASAVEGATLVVDTPATDDVSVASVDLFVNGQRLATDSVAPFQFGLTIPAGTRPLSLTAVARDNVGKTTTSPAVDLQAVADPLTTVTGTTVSGLNSAISGAQVGADLAGLTADVFVSASLLTALPNLSGLTPNLTKVVGTPNMPNPSGVFGNDPFGFGTASSRTVRFTGALKTTVAGTYAFALSVNAGGRLVVNGRTVIDLSVATGGSQVGTGTVDLPVGSAAVDLQVFENGAPEVVLRYSPPGSGGELLPILPPSLTPARSPHTAVSDASGAFSIVSVPTAIGAVGVSGIWVDTAGSRWTGNTHPVAAVSGGVTDVGQLTLSSLAWTVASPSHTPLPMGYAEMAYDKARKQTVLFGGFVEYGTSGYPGPTGGTWLWNGTDWNQASPATNPPERLGHAMAYDEARGVVVLFGGIGSGGDLGDTWLWDGNDWTLAAPATSPSARYGHRMVYDAERGLVVLFGGDDASETWLWDGSNWTRATPALSPPARNLVGMAYDAQRKEILMFGGALSPSGSGLADDTWVWDGSTWSKRDVVGPPPRQNPVMSAGPQGLVYLFGGTFGLQGDMWVWNGVGWEQRFPSSLPEARSGAGVSFDTERAELVMYGGSGRNTLFLGDTWILR